MRTIDVLQTAWSNLRRNKTRSILTIVAVFVGATTITLTNGIGAGIKSYLNRQVGSLGANGILVTSIKNETAGQDDTGPKKYDPTKTKAAANIGPQGPGAGGLSPFLLTPSDIQKIESVEGVQSVVPAQSLTVDYITADNAEKYQVDAQVLGNDFLTFDMAEGTQLSPDATENQVLLPSGYVSALGFGSNQNAVGKTVQFQVTNQNQQTNMFEAKVVGVVNKSLIASNGIVVGKSLASRAIAFQDQGKTDSQKNFFSAAITKFDKNANQNEIDALKSRLSNVGYTAVTIEDQQKTIFAVIDAVVAVLNMFGIVALAAASFGIVNTLYMAVQERTKEIGLMKAVGMSRRKIFNLFSIEAALLGLIGSAAGVLAANLLGRVINNVAAKGFLKDFEGLQLLSFELASVMTIVLLITFIAFLAGTLPAKKASKLDAIEALRYE
jgi:putative ABC transport system permease protein